MVVTDARCETSDRRADLNAGVLQRVIGRAAKPTGALVGAATGGGVGYKEGGLPGAVAGAAAGLFAPEMLTSPTTLMTGARMMASPATQRALLPLARGAMLEAGRPTLFGNNTQQKKGLFGQ